MKPLFFALVALLFIPSSAFATWSVIAVDRATGRVVISSATCVDRDDQFLMGVQAVVVPGKGVAACQAGVDGTHKNQMLVFEELKKGTDPKRIIEMLSADPAFQSRQFASSTCKAAARDFGLTNGYVSQTSRDRCPAPRSSFHPGHILRAVWSCRMRCRPSSDAGHHRGSRDGGHGSGGWSAATAVANARMAE